VATCGGGCGRAFHPSCAGCEALSGLVCRECEGGDAGGVQGRGHVCLACGQRGHVVYTPLWLYGEGGGQGGTSGAPELLRLHAAEARDGGGGVPTLPLTGLLGIAAGSEVPSLTYCPVPYRPSPLTLAVGALATPPTPTHGAEGGGGGQHDPGRAVTSAVALALASCLQGTGAPPYSPPLVAGAPSCLVGTYWRGVRACSVEGCGRYYHYACLRSRADAAAVAATHAAALSAGARPPVAVPVTVREDGVRARPGAGAGWPPPWVPPSVVPHVQAPCEGRRAAEARWLGPGVSPSFLCPAAHCGRGGGVGEVVTSLGWRAWDAAEAARRGASGDVPPLPLLGMASPLAGALWEQAAVWGLTASPCPSPPWAHSAALAAAASKAPGGGAWGGLLSHPALEAAALAPSPLVALPRGEGAGSDPPYTIADEIALAFATNAPLPRLPEGTGTPAFALLALSLLRPDFSSALAYAPSLPCPPSRLLLVAAPSVNAVGALLSNGRASSERAAWAVSAAAKLSALPLPAAPTLAHLEEDTRHFHVPEALLLARTHKPPAFSMLKRNVYLVRVDYAVQESGECECVGSCKEDCMNRLLRVECAGPAGGISGWAGAGARRGASPVKGGGGRTRRGSAAGGAAAHSQREEEEGGEGAGAGAALPPFSSHGDKGKRVSGGPGADVPRSRINCTIGPHCGNRALQLQQQPPLTLVETPGKGWGLLAGRPIPAGGFVIEYVGEVIDEVEQAERLEAARVRGEFHAYMMEIDADAIIDARFRANNARFINHSCDPNAELQRWNVGGLDRIAIFAVRDIAEGEEVTYDYQFFTSEETKCECGAARCRGFLGANVAADKGKASAREATAGQAAAAAAAAAVKARARARAAAARKAKAAAKAAAANLPPAAAEGESLGDAGLERPRREEDGAIWTGK